MENRCICYCRQEDILLIQAGMDEYHENTGREVILSIYTKYESFIVASRKCWNVVLVFFPGASGMEAVNNLRLIQKNIPLIWISDDECFAIHSYRVKCKMFLCEPVSKEELAEAMERCFDENQRVGYS